MDKYLVWLPQWLNKMCGGGRGMGEARTRYFSENIVKICFPVFEQEELV